MAIALVACSFPGVELLNQIHTQPRHENEGFNLYMGPRLCIFGPQSVPPQSVHGQ